MVPQPARIPRIGVSRAHSHGSFSGRTDPPFPPDWAQLLLPELHIVFTSLRVADLPGAVVQVQPDLR
jgi:hypothetical protein